MIGDHHGRAARIATLLVRAVDDILGTHSKDTDDHDALLLTLVIAADQGNGTVLAPHRHVQGVVQCLRKVRGERVVPLRLDRRQPLPSGISKGLGTAKRKPYRSYVNGV